MRFRNRARLALEALESRFALAVTFTVNTLNDTPDAVANDGKAQDAAGNTSLRAAIMEAESEPPPVGGFLINFQVNLTGTITLGSALPQLTQNYTITGPGSENLTVQRDPTKGVFRIFDIVGGSDSSIAGMTLYNGNSGNNGGGIVRNNGTLTLSGDVIEAGITNGPGGGIANGATGKLTCS